MNIGIITNSYPPNLNGVSNAVYNLQLALEKKGHKVFIATPKVEGLEEGENIFFIPSAPAPKYISDELRVPINTTSPVAKFFKEKGVQVIHSQDTMMGGLDAVFIANKLHIPCVHTYHTLVEEYEYFKFPGYKQFIRSYSQIVCDSHDGVVVLSGKIKDYLTKIGVSNVMYDLPNIINLNQTIEKSQKAQDFISKNGLDKTFNYISFGRVAKEKNITESIDILKPILKKYPDTRFIIAGDGPELEALKDYVKSLEIEDKVLFFGRYQKQDLNVLTSFSQVFFVTSTTEVLPTTPLEAMLSGLCVVAINDKAFDYIIRDGQNGYILPQDELQLHLVELYQKQDLLQQLKTQAKQDAINYTKKDIAQDYLNMYQDLIENYEKRPVMKTILIDSLLQNANPFNKLPGAHL